MTRSRRPQRVAPAALGVLLLLGCGESHPERSSTGDAVGGGKAGGNLGYVPDFPGAGNSGADEPLVGGMICDYVPSAGEKGVKPTTECFFGPGQTEPLATIEQVLECAEGVDAVHLRLTFNPTFVDNSYGENAIGWDKQRGPGGKAGMPAPAAPPPSGAPVPPAMTPPNPGMGPAPAMDPMAGKKAAKAGMHGKSGHSWMDLVGSDHAELVVTNDAGDVVSQFKVDYISKSASAKSGYASLGVLGGDGRMIVGDPADVVQWRTSIERNLNERGYDEYTVDSPATDKDYTPNPDAPGWDYRVVYEVWIDIDVFGESGFGDALIEHVHASPSKAESNTIVVEKGDCPCQRDGGCADVPPPPTDLTCDDAPEDPRCALE